jgi:hypothetical protein
MMGAEADALCGAEYGQISEERTNSRNCKLRGVDPPGRLTRPATGLVPCSRTVACRRGSSQWCRAGARVSR